MSEFLDEIALCVPSLRRYAQALTRNPDRADDLVQDTLERAIRKQALWQPVGPLKAWLFKVLLNLYRNDIRHRRRRGDQVPLEAVAVEPAVPPPQPGRLALMELKHAIAQLPAEQREALLLVVLEGLSYADAAAILGIPPGTLMSRLGRARAALRLATSAAGVAGEPRLRTVK